MPIYVSPPNRHRLRSQLRKDGLSVLSGLLILTGLTLLGQPLAHLSDRDFARLVIQLLGAALLFCLILANKLLALRSQMICCLCCRSRVYTDHPPAELLVFSRLQELLLTGIYASQLSIHIGRSN